MVGFLGNQPPKVPLTSADIADGTITNDDLAGSISNDKLAGSIANSKLATDPTNASNLASGTVPDARFPATLPAASGANLTSLSATNLGSGTVPTARLGSGTANSTTFLRGDQTYAEAGGGAWTFLAEKTPSGSANIAFTSSDGVDHSTYSLYMFHCHAMTVSSAGALSCQLSDDDGASFHTDSYAYGVHFIDEDGSNGANNNSTSAAHIQVGHGNFSSSTYSNALVYWTGEASTANLQSHVYSQAWGVDVSDDTSMNYGGGGRWYAPDSGGYDALRFMSNNGGNLTGTIRMYGLKKS